MILAHTYSSGERTSSRANKELTQKLNEDTKLKDITLSDLLVITLKHIIALLIMV